MTLIVNTRVQQISNTSGTGTITLTGTVNQFQTFASGIGDTNSTYYSIVDSFANTWEEGIGTFSATGNTLSRPSINVIASSNNNSLVNFSSNNKNVFCSFHTKSAILASPDTYPTIMPALSLDFVNNQRLDPRITFSRTTSASYYNGRTYALAEQNLFQWSNAFANTTVWTANNATIANNVLDPLGGTNAFSFTASSNPATLYQSISTTATNYTLSLYIQRVSGSGNVNLTFNGTNLVPQAISSSWARYSTTAIVTSPYSTKTIGLYLDTPGDIVNIYSAQLENRSFLTPDIITTTSFISNYIPQLMTAPTNVPRFDYEPSTGRPLGLLIEESRTNLITYSAAYTGLSISGGATYTANSIIAPDGTLTANKYNTGGISLFKSGITTNASNTYTYSFYCKPANPNNTVKILTDAYCGFGSVNIIPSTGSWTIASGSPVNASSTYVGNGWYRVSMTGISGSFTGYVLTISNGTSAVLSGPSYMTVSNNNQIQLTTTGTLPTGLSVNTTYYVVNSTGNTFNVSLTPNGTAIDTSSAGSGTHMLKTLSGSGSISCHLIQDNNISIFWGMQLEVGSFATSYIPTGATSVTRSADTTTITGNNFSSWYNPNQGSFYLELDNQNVFNSTSATRFLSLDNRLVELILTSTSTPSANTQSFQYWTNSTFGVNSGIVAVPNIIHKLACNYNTSNNTGQFSVNAGNFYNFSTSSFSMFGPASVLTIGGIGTRTMTGHVRKLVYYQTALSKTNLQALTSQ